MQPRTFGTIAAATAMIAVGAGVTVSAELTAYPILAAQAVRYALATAILLMGTLLARRRIPRPRGRDWAWLAGVAATGLLLFNVAIVRAVESAEPAAVAVMIGAVPLVLLLADSVRLRRRPAPALVAGAILVVLGAALVQGGGRTSVEGLGWAAIALLCEAAFTLLAVPILGRLGALGVSIHTCWIAALGFAGLAFVIDGGGALPAMSAAQIGAVAYLAVVLTAIAFVLWYSAVRRLGPATAGLFAGLMPVAAAVTGIVPGLTTFTPAVLGGSIVVSVGIVVGLKASPVRVETPPVSPAAQPPTGRSARDHRPAPVPAPRS